MKALVVFYSLEGHTEAIANIIKNELKCDLLELKPEKEIPKKGLKKFLWGGKSVLFKEKPTLTNSIPNLEQYETIIIGTPIWAGIYAPPINTFISENKIKEKKVAFFACHGGGGAKKCFNKLEDILKENIILGNIEFSEKEEKNQHKIKVQTWLKDIKIY